MGHAVGTEEDPAAAVRAAAGAARRPRSSLSRAWAVSTSPDATDGDAVRRLKERKRRPHKAMAVMVAGIGELRRQCRVTAEEEELLTSPEHPIGAPPVARHRARRRGRAGGGRGSAGRPAPIDPEVAVCSGVMLPYTPLHILLLREAGRPLVMTSGNLAEEPMVKDWAEVERWRASPTHTWCTTGDIAARCDDLVALVHRGRPRSVRRARGYAHFLVLPPSVVSAASAGLRG